MEILQIPVTVPLATFFSSQSNLEHLVSGFLLCPTPYPAGYVETVIAKYSP